MTITISPLHHHEIPLFVRIELDAFRSHPRIPMLWRRGYTEDVYAFYNSNKNESFSDPQCRFMKAVDDNTGEIVAVSEWTFALDVEDQKGEKEAGEGSEMPPANWPMDGNWELRRFFNLNLEKWMREYLVGRPYIKLEILVTHPDFQRRGAGSKLLAWGVEQADKHQARMGLESTPAGLSLYKLFGFKEVDVVKADMRQFGWYEPYDEEAAKRVWMIREPQMREWSS